jgi:hypothetical protein
MTYKCPLCGSALKEAHYHRVVKLQARKERVQKGELEKLKRDAEHAKKRQLAVLQKAKQDVANAKKAAADLERRKSAVRDKRLMSRIKKLEEEKKMLQKHTSPQEIGLADEAVLVSRLAREFPDDRIEHVGKGGDVLQYVVFQKEQIGCIVFECKHTDRIAGDHVAQTALAKKTREADYAILVTTGTRRGFAGLDQEAGIFLVAQSGALTLARICRESLISMAKQRLDAAAREMAAKRLMNYVTSPTCKTPIEEAILYAERAHRNLQREMRQHVADWKERHELYQTIHYDLSHVQTNIARVLDGEEPVKLAKPTWEPLALPMR